METHDQTLFRITRDAEVDWDGNSNESVREVVAERIRLRRYEPTVRIEFGPNSDPALRDILLSLLELTEEEAYDLPGPFDFNTLWTLAGLDLPDLRDAPWTPRVPAAFRNQNVPLVNVIQRGDMLVHVPYESFDASVERFIREGTTDPSTLGVKMTVYRVGDDTPFVRWLIMAAERGKQVACVIELKASLRREQESSLGGRASKSWCACFIRCSRAKDPCQGGIGGAPGKRWAPLLLPYRDRQLQRKDCAAI